MNWERRKEYGCFLLQRIAAVAKFHKKIVSFVEVCYFTLLVISSKAFGRDAESSQRYRHFATAAQALPLAVYSQTCSKYGMHNNFTILNNTQQYRLLSTYLWKDKRLFLRQVVDWRPVVVDDAEVVGGEGGDEVVGRGERCVAAGQPPTTSVRRQRGKVATENILKRYCWKYLNR